LPRTHEWTYKIIRKVQASKELWGMITGKVDTREKFESHRREMAEREWQRMKETDSRECRNCHNFEYMDFSLQGVGPPRCTPPTWQAGPTPASTATRDCAPTA
jgi:nitrate/TMAO reductase-like tetraheme cytochrome c subunit